VASRPRTESDLVEAARRGDTAAFAHLVRDHEEIAFRTAYVIVRNAADAEDAAQDAFVKAWRALPRFRRGAPVRPWLLRIVANEARNRRRGEGRRAALALVERLPDEQRLAVTCRYLLDLSEEETAAVLGVRRGTVKSRLSRALERMREAEAVA
jgi:DNA-directed RNA polymerase specialized sigma24 family protein